jgi:hypothetical protein
MAPPGRIGDGSKRLCQPPPVCGPTSSTLTVSLFHWQGSFVLPLPHAPGRFVLMADRWNERDLRSSRYVWLPLWVQVCFLTVNGTKRLGSSRGEDSRTTQSDATHQLTQPLAPGPKLPHQHRWFEGEGLSTSRVSPPGPLTHCCCGCRSRPPLLVSCPQRRRCCGARWWWRGWTTGPSTTCATPPSCSRIPVDSSCYTMAAIMARYYCV